MDRQDVACEKESGDRTTEALDLSNWKDGIALHWSASVGSKFGEQGWIPDQFRACQTWDVYDKQMTMLNPG